MEIYSLSKKDFSLLGENSLVPSTENSKFLVGIDENGSLIAALQYLEENLYLDEALTFVSIQTEDKFKGRGYMGCLLNHFFVNIVSKCTANKLRVTAYSAEGELFVKPAIKRKCKEFNIQLIEDDELSPSELIRLYSQKGC